MNLNIELPEAFGFLFDDAQYKGAYGGRGSAKSWSFARALVAKAAQKPIKILCCREIQGSIKDSVHSLLRDQIESMGLSSLFEVGESFIRAKNGSEIIYKGLRSNYSEIKSTEGIDIAWVEEAQAVSDDSWNTLIPTIRKSNSEIWMTFNPKLRTDSTYRRFVINPPPNSIIKKVNYDQNPWFTQELDAARLHCLKTEPQLYANIWEGVPLEEGDMAFFEYADIEKAMQCGHAFMGSKLIIGCDPSQGKGDKTAFCYRWGDYIEKIETFSNMDEMACIGYLVQELRNNHRLERVIIDSTGFGNTIVGRLREQGFHNITGVNFAESAQSPDYANKRAEMYGELRRWLRGETPVRLPQMNDLTEELISMQWKPNSSGKTALEPKEDIKTKIGRSPDMSDALALCFSIPAISVTMRAAGRPKPPSSRGRF
jgi:phage terminase large subunit